MIKDVKVIVFDADDTLWDNQSYFDWPLCFAEWILFYNFAKNHG